MITSIRHIAVTLAVFATLTIVSSTLLSSVVCSDTSMCVASVVFGLPEQEFVLSQSTAVSESTVASVANHPSLLIALGSIMQGIGVYTLTVAVVMLIALEAFELYYLRQLFRGNFPFRARTSR